jgi:RNA polymerase sigma factor (sigma-70 family)
VPVENDAANAQPVDAPSAMDVLLAHRAELVAFAAARLDSRAQAEDLVQESLARALERLPELRDGDAILGWFHRILRNAIVDHHRRRGASRRALERFAAEPEEPSDEPAGRVCRCVSHLAGTLKPEYAEALQRVEVDGAMVKDVAAELGITPTNAAVRVHRARESLRKKVMATCRACAEAGCVDCTCGTPEP